MRTVILSLALILSVQAFSQKDKVYSKTGRILEGNITSIDSGGISIYTRINGTEMKVDIKRESISKIEPSPNNKLFINSTDSLVIKKAISQVVNVVDSTAYELDYLRYNIKMCRRENIISEGFYIASFGSAVVGGIIAKESIESAAAFFAVSGILSFVGYMTHLDSYKWLNRASIKPTQYGVSFEYNFKK